MDARTDERHEKIKPLAHPYSDGDRIIRYIDNDNDVYFTLATSDSRIGKYKTENKLTHKNSSTVYTGRAKKK